MIKKDACTTRPYQACCRVLRRGSFIDLALNVRSAFRDLYGPASHNRFYTGFRPVVEIKRIEK
jgi:formylglycine-generating enzyme required for sulfatase activity